ncbi:MAG TPA: glycine zipper 2TM domain-containing protein [Methylophilaceae bacterium]|nr:glycine zipper 2TM domain-containing protein [Methylophilaceae bacterium]
MNAYKFGTVLIVASTVAMPAAADDVYYDTARVLSVTPQTERVNSPRQECRTEYIQESYRSGDRDIAGSIIGGVAGGLLGSQFGKGNGRVAAAAVGAATGAVVGDRIDNSDRQSYASRPVERCSTVDNWQTVNRGYLVTYRFDDRDYTTVMAYDPGRTMRVRVSIAPEEGERVSYLEPAYRRDAGLHRGWDKYHDKDHKHGRWDD